MFRIQMTECTQHFTTFRVFTFSDSRWVEFRGPGLQAWVAEGEEIAHTPAQVLFDGLLGWHSSVLMSGDECAILTRHADHAHVARLFNQE